jgi:hypothetical protein
MELNRIILPACKWTISQQIVQVPGPLSPRIEPRRFARLLGLERPFGQEAGKGVVAVVCALVRFRRARLRQMRVTKG